VEFRSRTVLLIGDDPHNRTFLLDLLIAFGYSVLVAVTGEEGLHMGLNTRPDLVLIDLGPSSLNSWTLARQLKESPRYSGAPVIALSAWARPDDEDRTWSSGCDAYLRKPIASRDLLTVLERFVSSPAAV